MADELDLNQLAQRGSSIAPLPKRRLAREEESDEEFCLAYGYLRGLQERAPMLELRYRDRNTDANPYSHLASWRFSPSVGLLLKYTSDVTTLVLVEGSNFDVVLPGRSINLIDRGIARHRITYISEMDEDDIAKTPDGLPTVDRITVAEFQSLEEQTEWFKAMAPAFLRK